jgi:hypothetical protein
MLHLSFWLVAFYPLKGMISFFLSLVVGSDISDLIIPFLSFLTLAFIILNLLANRLSLSKTDKILLLVGCFAIFMAILRRENILLLNTTVLFFLPPILYKCVGIDDKHFYKIIFAFFLISTIYMLAENIAFYPHRFGLPLDPISGDQYFKYGNTLTSASNYDQQVGWVEFDYLLSRGMPVRTGGYLGSVLIIPSLLAMAATFYYVLMREKKRVLYAFLMIVSVYLLINSISTTAIVAFFLTIIFYETYVRRKFASLLIIMFLVAIVAYLIVFDVTGKFVFQRMTTNVSDPDYVNIFLGFSFLNPRELLSFLIGRWKWISPSGVPTHVDLMNIILVYGSIAAYLLYKRMLFPLVSLNKSNSLERKVYALVVLTAFICLFHAGMTLNINVMLMVTLLFLKAGDLYRKEQLEKENLIPA